MGGWTIFCLACGGPPFSQEAESYSHESDCYGDSTNLPQEDADFLDSVCVVSRYGYLTPPGISDWPYPVYIKLEDTPENRQRHPEYCRWHTDGQRYHRSFYTDHQVGMYGPDVEDGVMIHAVCAGMLGEELACKRLTWQQVYDWRIRNVRDSTCLPDNFEYGFGNFPVHGQRFDLFKGLEWTTRRPDRFPDLLSLETDLPACNAADMTAGLGRLHLLPTEVLLLVLYLLRGKDLLVLMRASKALYQTLTAQTAQSAWQMACARTGWLPPSRLEGVTPDWCQYYRACQASDNMRNRQRITCVLRRLTGRMTGVEDDDPTDAPAVPIYVPVERPPESSRVPPMSPYSLYMERTMAEIKNAEPNLSKKELIKRAAYAWPTSSENPANKGL
ncbi:hypothetical protein RI367_000005 [Sorochytrium milnesiophthora]